MSKQPGEKTAQTDSCDEGKQQSADAQRPFGAQGYGLDEGQQKLASDLWAWQRESLRSEIVLGGPVSG